MKKVKLNKTQLAHGLNRVQQIYSAVLSAHAPTPSAVRRGSHINWNSPSEMATFVKKFKLPTPSWKEIGYVMTNGCLPNPFFVKVNEAVNQVAAEANKGRDLKLAKANALLGKAQDILVFDNGPTDATLPAFLDKFSEDLTRTLA